MNTPVNLYACKSVAQSIYWANEMKTNFNVFVFGLTDGLPDSEKILYEEYGVDYVDNGWNTHELTTPVTADGFMVAVSCDGFMGIGTAEVTDAYPYEYGAQYYAGDNYDLTISELGTWSTTDYFMLRAGYELEEENVSRSKVTYEVYRSLEGENNWTLVGTTDNTSFTDNYSDITEGNGRYEWKVVAVYANDMTATGVVSNSVEVITTSVEVNMADDTNVEFFDLNGIRLNQRPTEKGIYIMRTTDSEGQAVSRRMVIK
ncbi:MAG: hypothetical protein K2H75_01080 [Muribaculaceae bacterium]|nr:hypothetical protein [Muribaculaceae bacterium]